MITIRIDDAACVGCSLCVDECPTDVFTFDTTTERPVVERQAECFGCLSCSQLCPSDAIEHDGLPTSETHHHDPRVIAIASRLGADLAGQLQEGTDPAQRQAALEDLGVRLLAVAAVFRETLGGALPAVGTLAGRTLARQLPRYRVPESFEDALEMGRERFAPTWELEPSVDGTTLTLPVRGCFVRDVCQSHGLELGGDLCILFYHYMAGYLASLGDVRLRLSDAQRGPETCCYTVTIHPRH
jgi:NAD-dependent dihydropyrimidine dehydrogenase PreA subunit